ncbi:MAG: hypothetical protein Q9160_008007 [Pyrenula sp. 1 TL-2023]
MSVGPSPLSINPSQGWDGNDGPWSTFFLGIGTPPQYLHVMISLTVTQPLLVLSEGCTSADLPTCPLHRGGLFLRNQSSTWRDHGLYELDIEKNLGFFGNALFGYDSLLTGLPGTGAIPLKEQVVAGIAAKGFYLGLWGIGPRPINLTSLDNPYPSMMSTLKDENIIPSVSFGYTAGARYQLKQVPGSLTLGGYDASRFASHNTSFNFAEDVARDLVVGLQSITVSGLNSSESSFSSSLLPQPILSFIDAGEPQIWLPGVACDLFAKTFSLRYDNITDLYLVDEATHQALLYQNATITFTIAADITSTNIEAVTIIFPYAAFDLELTEDYPGINAATHYFPIRRAAKDTQHTLGRTFLQQAYIVADYERATFSVYPCVFSDGTERNLQAITSPSNSSIGPNGTDTLSRPSHSGHSFRAGVISAIVSGSIVAFLLISFVAFTIGRRRDSLDWYKLRLKALLRCQPRSEKSKISGRERDGPKDHLEMEGDVHRHGELAGDLHHPKEMIAGLQRPKELSSDTAPLVELEQPNAPRTELPAQSLMNELDTGTAFSYAETPISKTAGADGRPN